MFPKAECITWITVLFAASFATVTLNAITIFIFIKNRNLRNRSAYLIINLAVADMLVGGFSTFELSYSYGQICRIWKFNSNRFSYFRSAAIFLFLVCSLTNITVISLERLHATYWPFRHRVVKRWIYKALIAITWIIAGAISLAYMTLRVLREMSKYLYLWNLFNAFCLTIICISYASIYVKVRHGAQGLYHNAATRERKLTATLFIVTFLSLSLWLPYFVTWVVMEASDYLVTPPFRLIDFFILLVHANSLINPILYLIKISGYRRAFIALFRIRCQQQRRGHVFPINDI